MQIEYDSLTSKLESNPHLMSTTKILSLRYLDLPLYLKSSFKGVIFVFDYMVKVFFLQVAQISSFKNVD
jgi:hypothetical protein